MHHPLLAQPVKALIFDMDGTIVDSMATHKSTWIDFARKHGVTLDADEMMRRTTGRNGMECVRVLLDQPELDDATAWALVHEKEQLYREQFGPVFAEVPGFRAFYSAALAKGLRCGIGTAGDIHNVEFVLSHLQLNPAPGAIARGDEGLSGKPTPAIFLAVAERLRVSPHECIVFEDAPFGIEAARRGGMRAVGLCTGHSAQELSGPHVLTTAPDFETLLQSHFLETLNVATH